MRIACYAYIEPDSGSIAALGHLLVRELLRRGHEIDLFSKRSFVHPVELINTFPNLRYHHHPNRVSGFLHATVDRALSPLAPLTARLNHRYFSRNIVRAMRREHERRPFDATLYVGTACFGRVGTAPTVSWVQGAPGSDARSIDVHADLLRRTEGRFRLAMMRAYGLYRMRLAKPDFSQSDTVIVGSEVPRQRLIREFDLDADQVKALPYAIDLSQYKVRQASPPREGRLRVLWLGRIVPRKRLDLLLAAASLAIEDGCDLQLKIVGRFTFAPGLRQLIDRFPYPSRIEYVESVPRDQTPGLLREADLLAQPSDDEDFGSSVAEAMACGTPCIVGQTNGTGDYLDDFSLRLDDDRPETLRAAFIQFDRRKRAGELAHPREIRRRAEAMFDISRLTEQVETLLRAKP